MRQYLALLKNRNFVLHWSAGAISNVGDFFNSLALVKILSADPQHLGMYTALVMIAKVVPGILLGTVAGVMADRVSRRTVMVVSDLLRALLVLALVFVDQPPVIIGLIFLTASVAVFYNPASSALLPNLVSSEQLVTAGSLNVMTQRLAMLIGNGVGAVVLMAVGPHNVFYLDAVSFVISALLLGAMALPAAAATPASSKPGARQSTLARFKSDLRESAAFLKGAAPVRHLLGTFSIASLGDSALNVLLVTFFTVGLGLAAESLGYVWALFGGAALIGALTIGAIGHKISWRYLLSFSTVWIWFTMMTSLLIARPIPSVAFLALLGLGSGAVNVGAQSAVGQLVPDHVRGRIFGAWGTINNLIYVVGTLIAGFLSDRFGPAPTMMGFTTFYLLAGAYAFVAFRDQSSPAASEAAG